MVGGELPMVGPGSSSLMARLRSSSAMTELLPIRHERAGRRAPPWLAGSNSPMTGGVELPHALLKSDCLLCAFYRAHGK